MNLDERLKKMAAEEVIFLPQSYEERLKKVYASLEEHPEKARRRSPRPSRLLLCAALAAGCVLLAAMGTERLLPLLSGGRLVIQPDGSWSATNVGGEVQDPIVLEDGRLWFVANGERLDLTELVDEETSYLYTFAGEGSHLTHYVAVGGTAEDFGWAEWLQEGDTLVPTISVNTWEALWLYEGELYDPEKLTPELQAAWEAEGETHTGQQVYKGWYLSALDQLGLERPEAPLSSVWRGHPAP